MKKTFSVTVLDELYCEGTTANNIMSLTYDGPSTLDIFVSADGYACGESISVASVTVDANTDTAVAYLLHVAPDTTNYEWEEEVLEGSLVYKYPTNPNLHDYYVPKYSHSSEDTLGSWSLEPIIKDARTPGLKAAQGLLDRVESILELASHEDAIRKFDPEVVAAAEEYKVALEEYILEELPKKSWKYVDFTAVPECPSAELLNVLEG